MSSYAEAANGITVLEVGGRLTAGSECQELNHQIRALIDAGRTRILINLEQLRYIDSCGVGELIAALTTVRKHGGSLKLSCPQDKVQQVFDIVRLAEVVEIHPTQDDALKSFA